MLEIALHTCDISPQTREFSIASKWTYLLFDEFFVQGDLEKEQKLPVSMLCDRDNTSVKGSQPGFISFVLLPLFTAVTQFFPQTQEALDNLKNNSKEWQKMEENEEQLAIYKKKEPKKKVNISTEESKTEDERKKSLMIHNRRRTGIMIDQPREDPG